MTTYSFSARRTPLGLTVALAVLLATGCGVKKTVTVPVSPKFLQAKSATFDQLVTLMERHSESIKSLSSSTMRLTLISGKIESGQVQQYRSAPGYLLLRRPDSIRLNIQNPVTKTSIAELLSVGDAFSLWYPRENKFYMGSNSAKELELEGEAANPVISARPAHIFEAVLPQNLPQKPSGVRIAMQEDQDATTKYYILSVVKIGDELRATPVRKLWIDRSDMTIVRQQTFDEQGRIVSLIRYDNPVAVDGLSLPLSIRIERPLDGYSIDLQFKDWRLNPELPENAFVMNPPPGAKRVQLKEKG